MIKKKYEVSGMHCRSCEILIEDKLKKIKGIKKVHASTKNNNVMVAGQSFNDREIESALNEMGYEFGKKELPIVSKDVEEYKILFTAVIFLIALIILAKTIGFANVLLGSGQTSTKLTVVLGVGLVAGFSSCMALVGGLVLGVASRFAEKHPNSTPIQKFRPHLFFNLGRVVSYFALGGIIGELGSVFKLSGGFLGLITVIVGIVMLYLGLQLSEIFPRFSTGFTLPKGLTKIFKINKKGEKEYSHFNSFTLGALTFFLPCGFTQAMQVLAISSGNFWSGALIMATFAVGTMPGLLGIGGLTAVLNKGYLSRLFFKFVSLVLIVLAFTNLSNGFNLLGIKVSLPKTQEKQAVNSTAVVEGNAQVIRMTQDQFGYKPNFLTVKKGVPVKWVITSTTTATCASSIYMPEFGIEKILNKGENLIEFTPTSSGPVQFTCSMGMYRGTFNVTE